MPPLADPCPVPEAPSWALEEYSTDFEIFTGQAAAMLVEGERLWHEWCISGCEQGGLVGVDKG